MAQTDVVVAEEVVDFSNPRDIALHLQRKGFTPTGMIGSRNCRFLPPGRTTHDVYHKEPCLTRWLADDDDKDRDELGYRKGYYPVVSPNSKGSPEVVYQTCCTPAYQPIDIDQALEMLFRMESAPPVPVRGRPTPDEVAQALSAERVAAAKDKYYSTRTPAGGLR